MHRFWNQVKEFGNSNNLLPLVADFRPQSTRWLQFLCIDLKCPNARVGIEAYFQWTPQSGRHGGDNASGVGLRTERRRKMPVFEMETSRPDRAFHAMCWRKRAGAWVVTGLRRSRCRRHLARPLRHMLPVDLDTQHRRPAGPSTKCTAASGPMHGHARSAAQAAAEGTWREPCGHRLRTA